MSGRHAAELWPHMRFWKFEWLVRMGKAERSSTIRLRRVKHRLYAIFTYEMEPREPKEPAVPGRPHDPAKGKRASMTRPERRGAGWVRHI
ncbi:hypothetical protein [Pyrobaculum ferrireducens]|uniref:Uncharacterized protein n=1 Tax=Pyrobaculum ferrireducens TaxID=1104324 RepID=G7VF26_9CREN|nr:hypothetical protein [Pyrobaculum ferrireducens]AET34191.1 hypothetical protein P186_2815 [Pyrobaculum ferrireducens]